MTHEPLSERIENECNAAARNREPVLLVGTDRSLLERVAHRIHMLSPARIDRNHEERRKQYVSQSCVGEALSPEWANGPRELSEGQNVLSPLEIFIAENDTVHLSDVESSAQLVQRYLVTRIHASEYDVRLIFSSIIGP